MKQILEDQEVQAAIKLLKSKGVTIEMLEEAFSTCVNCGKPVYLAERRLTGGLYFDLSKGEWACSHECFEAVEKSRKRAPIYRKKPIVARLRELAGLEEPNHDT
mgnify:CR=1 FL=1